MTISMADVADSPESCYTWNWSKWPLSEYFCTLTKTFFILLVYVFMICNAIE